MSTVSTGRPSRRSSSTRSRIQGEGGLAASLNPRSLEVLPSAFVEPALAEASEGQSFQLERLGYFCVDPDSTGDPLVLNRTATLRDTWAKVARRGG